MNPFVDTENDTFRAYSHVQKPMVNGQLAQLVLAAIGCVLVLAACVVKYVTATFIALSIPMHLRWWLTRQDLQGLPIIILHRLVKIFVLSLFPSRGRSVESWFLMSVMSDTLLSTLKVANVHIVLNLHRHIPLHQLILSYKIWCDIFPAALLHSIASNSGFYFAVYSILRLDFENHEVTVLSYEISIYYVIFCLYGFAYFAAMASTYAIFIRLAASMRPFPEYRYHARSQSIQRAWDTMPPESLDLFLKAFRIVFLLECAAMGWMIFFCLLYLPAELHEQLGLLFVKYMA